MSIEDVKEAIEKIESKQHDDEAAHSYEDNLHKDVLQAIADGTAEDPKEMATLALTKIQGLIGSVERQLYEAELQRIGEDEQRVQRYATVDEVENLFIDVRNKQRAELRAKARAFYGITESEEEGN